MEILCDGNCHNLFELQVDTQLSEVQAKEVVEFLAEYGFVEMNGGNARVRISNTAKELFSETKI